MAIREFPILGPMTRPDASGDVFFEPYSVKDTGTIFDPMVLIFNNSANKDGVRGTFQVPQDYVGIPKVNIYWNANATSGSAVFDLSYLTRAPGDDMGATPTDNTDTVTTPTSGVAFNLNKSTLTMTPANFIAENVVLFELFRNNPSDSITAPLIVFGVSFEYSDA